MHVQSADLDVSRDVCHVVLDATGASNVAASPPLLFKEKRVVIQLIKSVDEFVDDVSKNQVQSFSMSCIRSLAVFANVPKEFCT